jgi:hypothetical protein
MSCRSAMVQRSLRGCFTHCASSLHTNILRWPHCK